MFFLSCFDDGVVGEDKVQSVAYLVHNDMTLVLEAEILAVLLNQTSNALTGGSASRC